MTNGSQTALSNINRTALWVSVTVGAIALIIYLIPSPIDPKPYRFDKSPPKLEGPLTRNVDLLATNRLYVDIVNGPESFAVDQHDRIYTGCADGKIWGFKNHDDIRLIAVTGTDDPHCGLFELEAVCGRPKGMKVDRQGNLIVADAYLGLLEVTLPDGKIKTLIPSSIGLGGVAFNFLNGLELSSHGIVYFTDSSTKWDRRHHKYEVIETNNFGRLLQYDLNSGEGKVLLSGLYLANGVALSADESYILIAEMSVCRIRKFYLKGTKKGQSESLMDNLPGYPDNIRRNNRGNFYVGLATVRYEGSSFTKPFLDIVAPYPALKRFVAKMAEAITFTVDDTT